MLLQSLTLQNFRNFKSLDLFLNQGFMVFCGPNGAGKTNLLEAIYFGGALRRFPDSDPPQLLKTGEKFFRVRLKAMNRDETGLEVYGELLNGRIVARHRVNNQDLSRAQYLGHLPIISFLPQDLNLLTHSPAPRRRYLNETLMAESPQYRFDHQQYEKALRQRNEVWEKISNQQGREADLDIWDDQLAEFGSLVTAAREKLIVYLNANLGTVLASLSPELATIQFIYKNSAPPTKTEFLQGLASLRPAEKMRNMTLIGPHRDEYFAEVNGQKIAGFISRGQMRAVILGLKILEKKYLERKLVHSPLLLLDDVFSEFDEAHQARLLDYLKIFPQVILTTTHPEEIRPVLGAAAQIYQIQEGRIEKENV